jgi:Leucine-rich repeat (LRR) protein
VTLLRSIPGTSVETAGESNPENVGTFFAGHVRGYARNTDAGQRLAQFEKLKHLKSVDLSGPGLKDEHFPASIELDKLTFARLSSATLSGKSLLFIQNSPRVRTLEIHVSQLDKSVFEVLAKLPELTSLSVSAKFDNSSLPSLAQIKHLRRISISGFKSGSEKTKSELLGVIANLQALESISLVGTDVNNDHLEDLERLPHLTHLALSRTKVTAAGLPKLVKLKSLTHLALDELPLSDKDLEQLQHFQHLEKLSIRQKETDGISREGFKRLGKLLPKANANIIENRFLK